MEAQICALSGLPYNVFFVCAFTKYIYIFNKSLNYI